MFAEVMSSFGSKNNGKIVEYAYPSTVKLNKKLYNFTKSLLIIFKKNIRLLCKKMKQNKKNLKTTSKD